MSLVLTPPGSDQHFNVSKKMGTSTLVLHPSTESGTKHHIGRTKHKHKKHKKHRRDRGKRRSKSEHSSSRCKLNDGKNENLVKVSFDNKTIGDHVDKKNEYLGAIEEMPDFAWLTKEFKFSDITDTFGREAAVTTRTQAIATPESELSQRDAPQSIFPHINNDFKSSTKDERKLIEQQIQDKYAEMDILLDKMRSKRHRSKRRRTYHSTKHTSKSSCDSHRWISSTVNICPIRREKRCAHSIREALLIRTAMRKAWKGMLGSCCGKGCWATWKWVSLRGVISDYE